KGAPRRPHGAVHVLGAGARGVGDLLAGGGVEHGFGLRGGAHPLAVDEVPQCLCGGRHLPLASYELSGLLWPAFPGDRYMCQAGTPSASATAGWVISPAWTLSPSRRAASRSRASATPCSASSSTYGGVALVS